MIKPEELRIGNYVYWDMPEKQGVFHKVTCIRSTGLHTQPISLPNDMGSYKPIPLSPAILEKCEGLMWMDGIYYIPTQPYIQALELREAADGYYPMITQSPEMSHEQIQTVNFNRINYLHQLQNLIFALTQTELIFKP